MKKDVYTLSAVHHIHSAPNRDMKLKNNGHFRMGNPDSTNSLFILFSSDGIEEISCIVLL